MKITNEIDSPLRILSLDGSDIYRAMHRKNGENGIIIKDKNGKLDTRLFKNFLDPNLDADQIKRIYSRHKELKGSYRISKTYTTALINVSFDFTVKEYFKRGKSLYVRDGYNVSWEDLTDHICIGEEDGETVLIAIEIATKKGKGYEPVQSPVDENLLEGLFYYDPELEAYAVKSKDNSNENYISNKATKKEIRSWLYENGFDVDGIHYVRYKRSAGSSREGHCLFIAEPLYEDMMEWSSCGLDASNVSDQASWQAYISLTLSSIEKKIHIPRQSILIIKDQVSKFSDTVVRVSEKGKDLLAKPEEVEIKNIIWDGEALLDKSVFDENGYGDKGMMLLRNRFFKTCAFNTNLQAWFADNGITKPSQLNGYYSSTTRSISDIKLVITESSLKYLKFKPSDVSLEKWFEKWLDNIYVSKEQSLFGVVKTDKATGPMNNKLVRTNYQLLNTIALTRNDAKNLLLPSMQFLMGMQTDPMFLRYHTNLYVNDASDVNYEDVSIENYRQRLISDMMRKTDDFEGTVFYKSYRTDLCKSFKDKLKHGRILIDGSYHTLLGNGIEFLHAIIDKNYVVDEPLALGDGEIFTKKFENGERLLCERSPHITMGNLFVATNKHVPEIEKYFNLGKANTIVCVNAIKSNLQQRLNGCDYDSDSMLITNHKTLRDVADKNYDKFLVPYCDVEPGGKATYTTSPKDMAELDIKIAENKIGEIVNLSQFLNSLYWDFLSHGAPSLELEDLYCDICKLAVLSGMEIDKAKRLYRVSADTVLSKLRAYKDDYKKMHKGKVPKFFAVITDSRKEDTSDEAKLNAPMAFILDEVESYKGRASGTKTISYNDIFELEFEKGDPTGAFSKRRDSILKHVNEANHQIKILNFISKNKNQAEKQLALLEAEELFDSCKKKIEKIADDHVLSLLLTELDKGEGTSKAVTSYNALLFASMSYAKEGYLFTRLKKSKTEMYDLILVEDNDADENAIMIFGHPHIKSRANRK